MPGTQTLRACPCHQAGQGCPPGTCPWLVATSLDDLAATTVRWLRGEIAGTPTYGPPDDETEAIRDHLIAINRCGGILTYDSQPGEKGEWGTQRAFLTGWATRDRAAQLAGGLLAASLDGELFSAIHIPAAGWYVDYNCPVTRDTDGDTVTWAGIEDPEEIEAAWAGAVPPAAIEAVTASYPFVIVDLTWGRAGWLWERLAHALGLPA